MYVNFWFQLYSEVKKLDWTTLEIWTIYYLILFIIIYNNMLWYIIVIIIIFNFIMFFLYYKIKNNIK